MDLIEIIIKPQKKQYVNGFGIISLLILKGIMLAVL